MPLDWDRLGRLVQTNRSFLLTTHVRPDSDGLGSLLAFREWLTLRGKEVRCIIASAWPPRYDFLDPAKVVERFTQTGEAASGAEVVVVLDTGTWNQLGEFGPFMARMTAAKVVIDHHISQDDLGAERFVDVTAEATGRLVYELITTLGGPLTPSMAHLLFAAVATDTGWFRHTNTTPATFALAEKLAAAGARPTELYEHLYEQNSLPRLRLMGLLLSRMQVDEDGLLAYTCVERSDYEATGSQPQDTEDMVNYTRSVQGVEVGLLFMEQPRGGVKVSFRSRLRVDVARVAEAFGGGGHRLASGAIVAGSMADVRDRVLAVVRAAIAKSTASATGT
jgi:bifunctional oligoribonuclease and PAP phosphatase NrnA